MAWIKVIEEEEGEGELKEVYDRIKRERHVPRLSSVPRVANVLKVQGLNPRALQLGVEFFWWLMRGESRLSFAQREMIATVVSATLHCRY